MARSCKWFILSCLLLIIPSTACLSPSPSQQQAVAKPIIVVKPDHLNFVIQAGKAYVSEQTITISNAGGGILDWSMSDNALWIVLEHAVGADNVPAGIARVKLDASGLAAGQQTGFITIVADSAVNSPVFVPVYLNILPATEIQQPVAPAVKSVGATKPGESKVVWQNKTSFEKYALVNACIVSGSITNTDKIWYLADVQIISKSGRSVNIAQLIPPGETVMYRRYIPCYQYEEVELKYTWQNP